MREERSSSRSALTARERELEQNPFNQTGRPGIPASFHECARTSSAARAKTALFTGEFETCGGSKNRRLRQCKISISQVLISRTLNPRGEVAERLKAAVC